MNNATAVIYLDRTRPKNGGICAVKIKVTYNRNRKYYATGIDLTVEDFDNVMNGKRRTFEQKDLYAKLLSFLNKAQNTIDLIPHFSFDKFENIYFENRDIPNSIFAAFNEVISQLEIQERLGTASSYNCAKVALYKFNPKLTFADITPSTLKRFEIFMLKNGNNLTTVGIYLRSLRVIFNLQNIDASLNPFGAKKGKYQIPTGSNVKKALTAKELSMIYNYQASQNPYTQIAKDYFIFLYLCNGLNIKDFCLLRWANIDGDVLRYQRAKTQNTRRQPKLIAISLKPQAIEIIRKYGQISLNKNAFIFPHLTTEMSATEMKRTYQQLTQTVNKNLKRIAADLGIDKNLTTYFARHSFATILKRSGASIGLIGDLLGHSSTQTTESYLGSFEQDQIDQLTNVLTDAFKIAN